MNKIMRYQIIKPIDCDWKQFNQILNELQNKTRYILNKTIQYQWEYFNFSLDYKKKYLEYPNSQDILGFKGSQAVQNYVYHYIKDDINKLNAQNICQTLSIATSRWSNDKVDILKGEKTIPCFKKNVPIDLKNKSIKIYKENEYYLNLSLISSTYAKELNRKSGQFVVLIKVGDNTQKTILERLLNNEYKISASQLIKYKNKWFINLSYGFEPEKHNLNENNIMGIDMGIVYPVYIAFNNSLKRYKIEGGEIESFRKQVEKRKNQMLSQGKYCGEGRIGHGTLTRIKPIQQMKDKVSNFRETTNHKYSKYIIDLAIKNNCGTIQMEDLTGISTNNKFLKNWSYYDLQQKIKYKAEEKGIKIIKIKPDYTSQRCNKCGYIHTDNRPKEEKGQSYFKCLSCGFETNADFNAARNIALPDIEQLIKNERERQEHEKLNKKTI